MPTFTKPADLPVAASVNTDASLPVQNGVTVEKATPTQIVNTGRPFASEAQAIAGVDATTAMSPLTTKQAFTALGSGNMLAANNLSDLANAATARANIGLAIGTDVQAYSAILAGTTASFLSADKTKLNGIETAATADQTGAEIKAAYEGETNAFTDTLFTKLEGIETAATADQTGAEIVTAIDTQLGSATWQGGGGGAPVENTYASRAAAIAATVDGGVELITVLHDGKALDYVRGSANSALTTDAGATAWKPAGLALISHWGAVGDWNGTTGTDSTTEINNALTWWAAGAGRHLNIPAGWYRYDGSIDLDGADGSGNWARGNVIDGPGRISFGSSALVAWNIHQFERAEINVNILGGGTLGNFSQITPTGGGTTAIRTYANLWCKFNVTGFNYLGRVLHCDGPTSDQFQRCVRITVNLVFGNSANITSNADNARVGQPLYVNTTTTSQIGGIGHFNVIGRGCHYGPVWERCNDIEIGVVECGDFSTMGPKMRGVRALKVNYWWTGEVNLDSGDVGFAAEAAFDGLKNFGWNIDTMQVLTSSAGGGVVLGSFSGTDSLPVCRINQVAISNAAGVGLTINGVEGSLSIGSYSCKNATDAVQITGVNGDISIGMDNISELTDHGVNNQSTSCKSLTITGVMRGGSAGNLLVNGGPNNNTFIDLDGLHLESSVCASLIGWGHSSSVVHIIHRGGSTAIGGSTTIYPASKFPRVVRDVMGNPYNNRKLELALAGTSVTLEGDKATRLIHTLSGNTTYTNGLLIGQEVYLHINNEGGRSITWPAGHVALNTLTPPTSAQLVYRLYMRDTTLQIERVAAGSASAIVSSGESGGASWTKFSDGRMTVDKPYLALNYVATTHCAETFTFPQAFTSVPAAIAIINATAASTNATPALDMLGPAMWGSDGSNNTKCNFTVYRQRGQTNFAPGDFVPVRVIVSGRWD